MKEKENIFVLGDDCHYHKDPILVGEADQGAAEIFIAFHENFPPEITLERMTSYPAHKKATIQALIAWYLKAARASLEQMGVPFRALRYAFRGRRTFFSGKIAPAFTFYFDLAAPIPAAQITEEDFAVDPTDGIPPWGKYILSVSEHFPALSPTVDPTDGIPSKDPSSTPEGREERKRETAGPDGDHQSPLICDEDEPL